LTAICRSTNVTISSWFLYDDEVKEVIYIHGDFAVWKNVSSSERGSIEIPLEEVSTLVDNFGSN